MDVLFLCSRYAAIKQAWWIWHWVVTKARPLVAFIAWDGNKVELLPPPVQTLASSVLLTPQDFLTGFFIHAWLSTAFGHASREGQLQGKAISDEPQRNIVRVKTRTTAALDPRPLALKVWPLPLSLVTTPATTSELNVMAGIIQFREGGDEEEEEVGQRKKQSYLKEQKKIAKLI